MIFFTSFVQEFVADPIDGVTLLLELLRTIQSNDTSQNTKAASAQHRRSLLDENSCLQCLRYSLRCPETTRRLAMASTGLFCLTVCIMSSVSKSRIIALEVPIIFSIHIFKFLCEVFQIFLIFYNPYFASSC